MGVGTIKVMGLQMTFARHDHPLKEQGVLDLVAAANSIHNKMDDGRTMEKTEVWFFQPEKCLETLGFTTVQPLVFLERRNREAQQAPSSDHSRVNDQDLQSKRCKRIPKHFGDFAMEKPERQSNDPQYWNPAIRHVTQHVVIVRFVDEHPIYNSVNRTSTHQELVESLIQALDAAS
jgi:hypothetical protein